jgi:signal transduction histidine kinase
MDTELAPAEVSRHKCLIYDGDPSEQLPVVVPLLVDGLRDNWRCLYLGDPAAVEMIGTALERKGIDTQSEAKRGALVLSSDRSHLKDGRFDASVMLEGLSSSIDDAVQSGFRGLCATGDMRWELGADENFELLLDYEARLDQIFRDKPLRGICQYHRRMVPAKALRDALVTHRSMFLGGALNRDNLFYVPPELTLASADGGAELGQWMYEQVARVLDAERARDEVLRDLERRVTERTAELAAANRHLESFSYSVSHDLRAPLRAIAGFATAISEDSRDKLDDETRKNLDRILDRAGRMNELIEGMLALGKVVEIPMRRVPIDLTALANDIVRELRATEPARPVDVLIQPGLEAVGDPTLVRAVLTNLVGNAWKFTSRRGGARIEVGAREDAFFVRDNGAGFDMEFAKNLFGAFQRFHSEKEFPGTGVGLATVERIVARHGGRVWAESRRGEGATFFFTLADQRGE